MGNYYTTIKCVVYSRTEAFKKVCIKYVSDQTDLHLSPKYCLGLGTLKHVDKEKRQNYRNGTLKIQSDERNMFNIGRQTVHQFVTLNLRTDKLTFCQT